MSRRGPSMRAEVLSSRMGRAGVGILAALVALSAATLASGIGEAVREWNDPAAWLTLPRSAVPAWANVGPDRLAEHTVVAGAVSVEGAHSVASHALDVGAGAVPPGLMLEYAARHSGSALLELHVVRPDGARVGVAAVALAASDGASERHGRVFLADESVRRTVEMRSGGSGAAEAIFGDGRGGALAGRYAVIAELHGAGGMAEFASTRLTVDGGAYGLMGTDEMRRDLAVGLAWGAPLALFVGVSVAVASVLIGLAYGMYAGYRGGRADEAMMRANDVVYALPALPFLVILAVTLSSSIFVMVAFLVMFGWVAVAKVSRSMALQARARGYVEASRLMGQRDSRTILRHVMPQLLPYALASIAISVPAAITTEAGLSFLGLGDPEYPTWGQMLRDASLHGAAARGLWWWVVPPGLMIALTGLAFVFIGGSLDAAVNPRMRRA
ncbi:MAG: ABC transporter permease [Thaumarchaeota archaeon]|nr:ABC transporter permease [Nitrososphaerota archaeon]